MHKQLCVLATLLATSLPTATAQVLVDGNFDNLAAGTAPDCGVPAGAWRFPPTCPFCDPSPWGFSIVDTNQFDPERPGRSLHVNISGSSTAFGIALTNILASPIIPDPGRTIRSTWDIFVTPNHLGENPLAVYIGADMSGGACDFATDRGPQMAWWGDGRLTVHSGGTVVYPYPRNEWQSVQVDIHLDTQTWDFYWAPSGQPLQLLASNLTFRSTAYPFAAIDRWSVAHFDGTATFTSDCYIDNVTMGLLCEANCDSSTTPPILNVADFSCFLNRFAAGDPSANCDRSTLAPVLNIADFACFLNAFAAGCS